MTFEKEVAEKVILPKLRDVYNAARDEGDPIKNKSDFRKKFMAHEEITLSAAKFDEYLSELNITFKKVVVIEGLGITLDAPPPARPSGRAVDGEEVIEEITGEEVSFDGEDPQDFQSFKSSTDNSGNRRGDMFNQL